MKYVLAAALLVACQAGEKPVASRPQFLVAAADTSTTVVQGQNFVFGSDTVRVAVTLSARRADTVYVHDTIVPPPVPASGVDTTIKGDTTKFAYWHTGKIVDSTKTSVKPPPVALGKPFGATWVLQTMTPPYTPFTTDGGSSAVSANTVLDRLTKARDQKIKLVLGSPCGSHNNDPARRGNCLRDSSGIAVFSWKRFDSTLDAIATSTVKSAITKATTDGVLLGWNILDEPWVKTNNSEGNTWGPNGLTRAQADTACLHTKQRFPTVPVGLSDVDTKVWPVKNGYLFKFCDFGVPQYNQPKGPMKAWRDSLVALATRGGYKQLISFNIVNFSKDLDGTWDCKTQNGGVKGSINNFCVATGPQVLAATDTLGDVGCGAQIFWRYDQARITAVAGLSAGLSSAAQLQAKRQPKPCPRRS